ncbi:MAG: hypothetical protein HY939_00165 [Gammaproteobacteria bacterium]|nr:hypothetical protein [Gammaproteobacteria bacterium]
MFKQAQPILHSPSRLCQYYLETVYQRIAAPCPAPSTNKGLISETYGEVLYHSLCQLIHNYTFNENDILFDLGSGTGRIALPFFLLTSLRQVCGIEILPAPHHIASQAANIIQQELPGFYKNQRRLSFLLGSFLDIPIDHATVLFISATCFDPSLMYSLSKLINCLERVHTVFTLRPLPNLKRLVFKKVISLECSWDSALCYVYGYNR